MEQPDFQKISELMLSYMKTAPKSHNAYHNQIRFLYKSQQASPDLVVIQSDQMEPVGNHSARYKQATAWFETHSQNIDHFLSQHGMKFKLVQDRIISQGGSGNKTKYTLAVEPVVCSEELTESLHPVTNDSVKLEVVTSDPIRSMGNKDISLAGFNKLGLMVLALWLLGVFLGVLYS
jgi:hypothetical protein